MKIKCLIIDDEELAIRVIKSYIEKVPFLELAGSTTSPFKAMDMINNTSADLVFLDIEMPELNGMDLIKSVKDPPAFIFVTAYREYAADAFDLDSVDYLVKPVSFPRFLKAVNKFRSLHTHQDHPMESFIHFRADRKTHKIDIGAILYIEGLKDYVKVHLDSGQMIIVKETMNSLEEKLNDYAFLRCHKSYIVSSGQIKAFSTELIEINDKQIPIGRSYREEVMQVLNN